MKFYKYWARGEALVQNAKRPWKICAYGGSDNSMEDAHRSADDRARRTAAAIERGNAIDTYGYSDRPLREEIVQEIRDATDLSAVITRNCYGSLVLNTSRVMFVDVDYARPTRASAADSLRGLWNRLRGKAAPTPTDNDSPMLERFAEVGRSEPALGYRVYRTAGGFRLLVTSDTYDPKSDAAVGLLKAFGSDPLYVRLCTAQECFRARLSAKFWRCGASRPPSRFPWASSEHEKRYRQWEEDYHRRANQFATCQLIGSFGQPGECEAARPIVETHDRLTMQDGAKLA
jgi:hypothetical protein